MSKKRMLAFFVIAFSLFGDIVLKDIKAEENIGVAQIKALQQELSKLRERLDAQQKQLDAMQAENSQTMVSSPAIEKSTASISSEKSAGPILPDIGVVADIVGTNSDSIENEEGNDRISVREVEIVLGSDIDPYARLDATIAFSDFEEASLEEAYASYWGLPGDIKGRIGRMHPAIGKAAAVHRDSLETVDEPLVIQRYLGAEGLSLSGLDFSGFMPYSTDSFTQQLTVGMFEGGVGEGGEVLGEDRNRPTLYVRLSNYLDISEASGWELAGSYLLGSADDDAKGEVNLFGIDSTYTYHIDALRKVKLQGEIYFSHRNEDSVPGEDEELQAVASNTRGFYGLADYRFGDQWSTGLRYDWVEPIYLSGDYLASEEQAYTAYLSFYQSEFARWRLQYQHIELLDDSDDDRLFVQATFAIGVHKHQIQ